MAGKGEEMKSFIKRILKRITCRHKKYCHLLTIYKNDTNRQVILETTYKCVNCGKKIRIEMED